MHACLGGHLFATALQAQSFFNNELENLRSQILAAQDNVRHIGGTCNALTGETRQAVAAHAAAVEVSLHSNSVHLLALLLLVDLLCMRPDILDIV